MLNWGGLDARLYGLHFPRAGGTTEAFAVGILPHIIDLKGRWRSVNTKYRYLRLTDSEIVALSKKSIPY